MSWRTAQAGALAVALTLGAEPARAVPPDCETADNEALLMACAKADLDSASARIAEALRHNAASLNAASVGLLSRAQAAWESWRDAECAWNGVDPETNRVDRIIVESCRAQMTLTRAEELEAVVGVVP